MSKIPSIELLNATHQFPCLYTYKAIGKVELDFVGRLQEIVQRELGQNLLPKLSTRHTPDGKHVSVTIEIRVGSAEKIVTIYERILTVQGLVLLL